MGSRIKKRICRSVATLALALGAALPALVVAEKTELTDEALSEIYGQALIDLATTDDVVNGFQFTRIGFGAEGTINANLRNVQLGQYADPAFPTGPNGDIDIGALQLGRLDVAGAELVRITNPYIEVAYRNIGNDATREFIGLRVGFEGIQGDIGVILNVVSGSVLATDDPTTVVNEAVDFNARRQTSVEFPALAEIDVLRAGDAAGASRDFWVSLQKVSLAWPTLATGVGAPVNNIAQAGFWLNWRDRLQAVDVAAGHAPPNNNLNY